MSYVTLEAKIEDGRILVKEREKLPANGTALVIILTAENVPGAKTPRPFGLAKGEFVVPDDFNEPLPEEILREFEGR